MFYIIKILQFLQKPQKKFFYGFYAIERKLFQLMDNINFTGGFLLKSPKPQQWSKIYDEIVPRNRVIVNDLKGKDNVFFATKNCYDPSILKYLIDNKVRFTFYPKINLKSRIDSYYPEKAAEILDAETEVITLKRKMLKYLDTP